ncbi:hypothetical protein HJC23_011831 [Cyclotella cryptica]|uniref:Uncharacterized protein n=1 Tax=Cyclotella cryptica TaxID=29204 RepID=A0ABD3QEK3_9STRA|eukprot:CCRYP_006113-RA/>CCRYP_006113-RA protein AED:0.17 eAED:0.17 QI:0/-1/0/1/-1/1/1/0/320
MPNTDSTNPYVALREAKIARNEARLAQLGLLKRPSLNSKSHVVPPNRRAKRRSVDQETQEPVRRSRRISQQQAHPGNEDTCVPSETSQPRREHVRNTNDSVTKSEDDSLVSLLFAPGGNASIEISTSSSTSVRSVDIDVDALILGKNGVLGRIMEKSGKEYVINKAFDLSASSRDKQRLAGARLSFNKYCGIQEWHNAIFLWVNLGYNDSAVVNDFLDNGKRITWFGGSRMHDETAVVHKLLQYGSEATSSKSKIVLWCRKYMIHSKSFTPYVCLGRLSYHSHVPRSHPLSFVWNLVDAEALRTHPEMDVKEQYQSLILM